jgi:hypothetical protein
VAAASEDLPVQGPLEPERAVDLLVRVAGAADAAIARSGAPVQYRSPEQLLGRDAGERSEVYSLSALLYQYLTGSVPFPHGRRRAVLFWHLHAPRPRPTALRPELPKALDEVIARGMAPDPAARHPTADALMADARKAIGTRPRARRPAPPGARAVGHRRKRLMKLAVALGLGIAAGATGFAVGGALDDPRPGDALVSAGPLRLAAPADWRRSSSRASIPLADAVVLAPVASGGARLVAGIATPEASVALLGRLRAAPRGGELVALGPTPARRYRAGHVPGLGGPITVFVAPADGGVATVACLTDGASAARAFLTGCESAAASLRLAQGGSAPAGPSRRQAAGLRRALRRLNAARSSYQSRIARSRTAGQQAAAARMLSRAHAGTARALRELALTGLAEPGARAAIGALERSTAAYRGAARAAVHRRARGYARARRSAVAADAALRRALRSLRVVGYAG